jgi:DNA-binding transcriptional ArsR family regulator
VPLADMKAHAADAAGLLKAVGNEQRLLVLCSLSEGPLAVGDLNRRVPLSQSALSQHLAKLREAGLVETRREAQTIYYSLAAGPVTALMSVLRDIYCTPKPAPRRGSRRA